MQFLFFFLIAKKKDRFRQENPVFYYENPYLTRREPVFLSFQSEPHFLEPVFNP